MQSKDLPEVDIETALHNLLKLVVSDDVVNKPRNPYSRPEVKQAIIALARAHGDKRNYSDILVSYLYGE